MKLNKLLLIGLFFLTSILNAQTDFRPGYVINNNGDTLNGEIDYRGDLLMSSICTFKNKEGEIIKYYPDDITAFRFVDNKYYISREINDKKVFLEYLIKGKINVYYMRDNAGNHYYVDKTDIKLTELPYEEGVKYVDDKPVFYESKTHIRLLNYCMKDAPNIQSKINSIKKPEHKSLIRLAEEYHNAVCKDEQCIIYEKLVPLIKISPELAGGVIKYLNVEDLNEKLYINAGLIGHISMPRTSEKVFFRTGVLLSQLEFNDEKSTFYKIPLQLEYIYPRGIFRPRIAYGLNINIPNNNPSVSFNFGGNIKLSKTFFLSVISDIEFNQTGGFFPKDLLSYSLQLGLLLGFK